MSFDKIKSTYQWHTNYKGFDIVVYLEKTGLWTWKTADVGGHGYKTREDAIEAAQGMIRLELFDLLGDN